VFNYPYSFRTEKIWKPIAVGHPFIAVANRGFYRDLHRMGFRTFGHVINEKFDLIDNSQDRIERIAQVVEDLCQQDLASFYKECYNVCKYNQELYTEMRHQVPRELPNQIHQFINQHVK
jgi:Iap family predicted aminopeptidase